MSRAVWKFPFSRDNAKGVSDDEVAIAMPRGAVVLSVGYQVRPVQIDGGAVVPGEVLTLWALVDPFVTETTTRRFVGASTGYAISEKSLVGARFVGTAIGVGGRSVTHLWEVNTSIPEGV